MSNLMISLMLAIPFIAIGLVITVYSVYCFVKYGDFGGKK